MFTDVKYWVVESLQSHMIFTMSHWSSGVPVCFLSQRTQVQIPRGALMWNRDFPVSVVLLQWWPRRDWSWTGLRPQLSLGPRADNVTVPLDLTQLSCPGFMLAVSVVSLQGKAEHGLGAGILPPPYTHCHTRYCTYSTLFSSRTLFANYWSISPLHRGVDAGGIWTDKEDKIVEALSLTWSRDFITVYSFAAA